ncbi:MAG: hypothetical protein LBD74_01620 [Spirochaetaceae bacterium]|nr:hypothetical protein [Spirochaetaceae bacterium]
MEEGRDPTIPKPKPLDRELVYYYSRERRLARASPAVRELNRNVPKERPSLIGPLTSNRAYTLLFVAIIVCTGFGLIFSRVGARQKAPPSPVQRTSLGGNSLKVSAQRFPGTTYLRITKTAPDAGAYTGAVDMAFTPQGLPPAETEDAESPQVISHRIFFNAQAEETYGLSLPFEAPEVLMLMQTEQGEQRGVLVKPDEVQKAKNP